MDRKYTNLKFSVQNYFYTIAALVLSVFGLFVASGFLIPICFAILVSFILLPTVRFLQSKGLKNIFAIVFTFVVVLSLLGGVSYFFSSQIAMIISDFQSFRAQLSALLDTIVEMYNTQFSFFSPINANFLVEKIHNFIQNSGGEILGTTLSQTTVFFTNLVLTPIYVFLLLLYRKGLVKGILLCFKKEQRNEVKEILYHVQSVGKDYIIGLITVMLILSILNSTFLLIVGVDYAIMFGCLSAILIIIPYIGPFVGGILPIIYGLATMGPSTAFIIMVGFIISHLLESNFLTPKIVGSNTSVNALSAFMALVVGGTLWGIPGMILAIPLTAMLKKVFMRVSGLRPIALLLGEELYEKEIDVESLEIEYIQEKKKLKYSLKNLWNKFKKN